MHRFFCTICKKVKRVHADPFTDKGGTALLELTANQAPIPARTGVCRFHVLRRGTVTRAKVNSRVKVHTTIAKQPKAQPQQKGRK